MTSTSNAPTSDPTRPPKGLDSRQRVAWWREHRELLLEWLAESDALTWADVLIAVPVEDIDADLRATSNPTPQFCGDRLRGDQADAPSSGTANRRSVR
jgi:hypothetical protein